MFVMPETTPDPNDVLILQQVQQFWSMGDQDSAMNVLRPRADADVPWAAAFMAWLLAQQGAIGHAESIQWALRAARLGAPWQATQTFLNVVNSAPSDPSVAAELPALLRAGAPWMGGIDVIGQGWNLIIQGQPEVALRLFNTTIFWPSESAELDALTKQTRVRLSEFEKLVADAAQTRANFDTEVGTSKEEVTKATDDLTTSARQAGLLVSTVLSDSTNSLYKADATRNEKESKGAWRAGLVVLGLAAIAALLPVMLHYLKLGPEYSTSEVIGVHLASTAALGTFSGVLLARARSRDHAAQRAHDLSTAMGTMISYSNQISDPIEKEPFMMTMGQVVMQAHLSTGSGSKASDDTTSGILALTNAIRNPGGSTNSPA
jgi:hypothetical protein